MADEEPAPAPWIQATMDTLGKLIRRPKLTANLLKKPPFRFIHDVVSEVTRSTTFGTGLFKEEWLNGRAIKNKEDKIGYLSILISAVGLAVGRAVNVNPKKIVAGHEPEKTNALFQALHEAATGDPDRAAQAVQQALAGEKPGAGAGPPAAVAPPKAKPGKRPQSRGQNAEGSERPKPKSQPPPPAAAQPPPPGENFPPPPSAADEPPAPAPKHAEKPRRRRKQEAPRGEEEAPPAQPPPPAAADRVELPTQQRPVQAARPQTARKAPPKIKSNEVPVEEGTVSRSNRAASREASAASADASVKAPNVIGENDDDSDSDDGMIIEAAPGGGAEAAAAMEGDEAGHGALVRNFMSAAKPTAEPEADRTESKKPKGGGIILTRKINSSNTESYHNELVALRKSIQVLSQSTNPLGKCMASIQEDVETMQKELEFWRTERRSREVEYEECIKSSEHEMDEVEDARTKANENMREMQAKINAIKSQIMKNDTLVNSLLGMVTKIS